MHYSAHLFTPSALLLFAKLVKTRFLLLISLLLSYLTVLCPVRLTYTVPYCCHSSSLMLCHPVSLRTIQTIGKENAIVVFFRKKKHPLSTVSTLSPGSPQALVSQISYRPFCPSSGVSLLCVVVLISIIILIIILIIITFFLLFFVFIFFTIALHFTALLSRRRPHLRYSWLQSSIGCYRLQPALSYQHSLFLLSTKYTFSQ